MIKSMAKKEITILNDLQIEKKISKSENVDKDEKKVSEKNVLQGRWDQARNEIKHIADAEGHGIDDGIKDVVIALNAFNINTGQSCEGHFDSGMSAPWIRIEALNEPEERFVSIDARSPTFSIAGPEVILICACVSFAIKCASVVLPRPGGP